MVPVANLVRLGHVVSLVQMARTARLDLRVCRDFLDPWVFLVTRVPAETQDKKETQDLLETLDQGETLERMELMDLRDLPDPLDHLETEDHLDHLDLEDSRECQANLAKLVNKATSYLNTELGK